MKNWIILESDDYFKHYGVIVIKIILKKCNCNITWSKLVLLAVCMSLLAGTASATLGIKDFFSDYTSSEVTIRATQYHQGKAVFELLDGTNVSEYI